MKTKFLFSIILLSCSLWVVQAQTKERREVGEFEGIALSIDAKVYVKQGPQRLLEIEAKESTLEKIETYVKGDKLVIKDRSWNLRDNNIKIWIVNPGIESLAVSGSGEIFVDERLESDELTLAVSGSGGIMVEELTGDEVEAAVSGSGKIKINGTADEMEISISGSGKVDALDLKVSEAEVAISGSGSSKVFVTGDLEVAVSGSGDVYFKGDPQLDARVSGSGKVKELED